MAGGKGNEFRIFVNLSEYIPRTDNAKTASVEQPDFDVFFSQGHPWINIGRIIVVINEEVIAAAKLQTSGDEAEGQRGRADEGDFLRLALKELGAQPARFGDALEHEFLLVAQGAF